MSCADCRQQTQKYSDSEAALLGRARRRREKAKTDRHRRWLLCRGYCQINAIIIGGSLDGKKAPTKLYDCIWPRWYCEANEREREKKHPIVLDESRQTYLNWLAANSDSFIIETISLHSLRRAILLPRHHTPPHSYIAMLITVHVSARHNKYLVPPSSRLATQICFWHLN